MASVMIKRWSEKIVLACFCAFMPCLVWSVDVSRPAQENLDPKANVGSTSQPQTEPVAKVDAGSVAKADAESVAKADTESVVEAGFNPKDFSPPQLPAFRTISPTTEAAPKEETLEKPEDDKLDEVAKNPGEVVSSENNSDEKQLKLKRVSSLTKRDDHKGLYRIKLEWPESNRAALFFYNGFGYMVFDQPGYLSGGTFPNDYFENVKIIPHNESLIVRFKLRPDKDVQLARLAHEWVILVGEMKNEMPSKRIHLNVATSPDHRNTVLKLSRSSALVTFQDPDTRHTFSVIPYRFGGVDIKRRNLLYDFLATYQGIAFLNKAPEILEIWRMSGTDDVIIGRNDGNAITAKIDPLRQGDAVPPLLDLQKYNVPTALITSQKMLLQRRIMSAPNKLKRLVAEENLAKFFVSVGFYHEAAGVVALIKKRYPNYFYSKDSLLLLSDLSNVLAHAIDDDEMLTNVGDYEEEPERHLIMALHEQRFGRDQIALERFIHAYKYIANLPSLLRNDVVFQAMGVALATGFRKPIFQDLLDVTLMTRREKDEYTYAITQARQLLNPNEKFIETYSKLTFSTNDKIALLAHLALVDRKDVHLKSLIKDLESIKYRWRGDIIEQKFLATLADLYLKAGNTIEALRCLRVIASYLWKLERSHIYTKRAEDIFYKSFMGMSDKPMLEQIGFYYEFEDVTPRGKRFGQILARVTDLYMKVGLLSEAVRSLDKRLSYLAYEKKRKTITSNEFDYLSNMTKKRLAELHFMARDYTACLKTLETLVPIPDGAADPGEILDMVNGVKLLKAMANIKLEKYDIAIKTLDGMKMIQAQRLLADALISKEEWLEAFLILGNLLSEIRKNPQHENLEADAILDLAVVVSHMQDEEVKEALIHEYADRITDPEKRKAFDIITSSPEPLNIRKDSLQANIATAANYVSVMDAITKDLMNSSWQSDGRITQAE